MSDFKSILTDLRFGDFEITFHAKKRMMERGITVEDIQSVGATCFRHKLQSNGAWIIFGEDSDGDVIRVVCAFDGDTVIITVMG